MGLCPVIRLFGIVMIAFWQLESIGTAETSDLVASNKSDNQSLDATQIVERMLEYLEWRDASIAGYTNVRDYHVEYDGIIDKKADMQARMNYTSPNEKQFEIIEEIGSKLLCNRVLRPLLESEVEAEQDLNRQESAIHPNNYSFRLLPSDVSTEHNCYILEVIPKRKAKFLFEGKIWIDKNAFAIVRIEGKPAKKPSWWIKDTHIVHTYRKVGNFWMHDRNESNTRVRLFGGGAVLTIRYWDYEIWVSESSMPFSSAR